MKISGKIYRNTQSLALIILFISVLASDSEYKFAAFAAIYFFSTILMDIRGLLLDKEAAKKDFI